MSASTRTKWGYLVNASGGTGAVTVYAGPNAGTNINVLPAVISMSMAGSATTDYAVLTDGDNNIVAQLIAQGANYQVLGGVRIPGLTCQCFGGTNGTVAIYVS